MHGFLTELVRRPVIAVAAASILLAPATALARGPDNIADVAEKVIDAVVNISTSQKVEARGSSPQLPPGSPFEEFFEEFFRNRRGQGAPGGPGAENNTPARIAGSAPRAACRRSVPASSSIRRASWSPTTTSLPTLTK